MPLTDGAPADGVTTPAGPSGPAGPPAVAHPDGAARVTAEDLGVPLGSRATLVQLSSTFCAPCRATRRVLERLVATDDGVVHVDLDVADRPDLGARFDVTVTPTVLVLDADGAVLRRASGAPTLAQARAAVALAAGPREPGVRRD